MTFLKRFQYKILLKFDNRSDIGTDLGDKMDSALILAPGELVSSLSLRHCIYKLTVFTAAEERVQVEKLEP